MAGTRLRTVALLAAVGAASGLVATGAAAPARAVELFADRVTVDATTGDGEAVGRVRITDGRTTATADRARLAQRAGRVVLTGGARVVAPQGALAAREITVLFTPRAVARVVARDHGRLEAEELRLEAPEITIVPAREEVTASGGVALAIPPDVTARGQRVVYRRAEGRMVLDGEARLVGRDGSVEGARLDGDRRLRRVHVTGPVRAVYGQLAVESETAVLDGQAQVAVFTGGVRAVQPGRRLATERLTVWYAQRRLLAEGPTWILVDPQP